MKIVLFSMTRTRSSFLLDVVTKHYNLNNLFEYYIRVTPHEFIKNSINKDPNKIWEDYKVNLEKETNNLFNNNDSFGIKIFPWSISGDTKNVFKMNKKSFKDQDIKIEILDLDRYFNLSQYDMVFLLNRNSLTDSICSHFYAKQTGRFLINKEEKDQIKHLKPKGKLYFTNSDQYLFRERAKSFLILKHLPIYFHSRKIPFIQLDYDDVPRYVKENYANIESDFIDTEFDYKSGITNYNEIDKEMKLIYNECKDELDWEKLFL